MPSLVGNSQQSAACIHRSDLRTSNNTPDESQSIKPEYSKSVPAFSSSPTDDVQTEPVQLVLQQDAPNSSQEDGDGCSEDTDSNVGHTEVFGFQTKAAYEQQSRMTNLIGVLYNGRIHRFVMLDSRGLSSWLPGSYAADAIKREFIFPKYKTKLLHTILFCKKYNVYFAICNDFTLKVYNRDFHETCKIKNRSMHSILHLNFNPVTDELISAGVAGTTVWKYALTDKNIFETIKPMANYELRHHADHSHVGGTWCTKVELDVPSQCVFYIAEADLYAYDAQDYRKLFEIHNAHNGSITSVGYSVSSRLLITGGVDAEIKVWGSAGGHICTLRGHSRAISSVIVHPYMPGLVFTSSMDGFVKIWSLHTMEMFYSISAMPDGIHWMNVTDDGLLWCANVRKILVLKFNPVASFWGHARCQIVKLNVLEHEGKAKRVMALGEDGSVRLFSQNKVNASALCTVLPPPVVSLLSSVKDVTLSRFNGLVFLLINSGKLWIYTAKTDPACRIASWDIPSLFQGVLHKSHPAISSVTIRSFEENKAGHGGMQILPGKILHISPCSCILAVFSKNGFQYRTTHGICSARSRHLLLLGLEDGRIVFMDQKEKLLYCTLKVHKEAILSMDHEPKQDWLITHCNFPQTAIFRIWSLPELRILYSIHVTLPPICYAVLDNSLITGHHTGHLIVHQLDNDDGLTADSYDRRPEHRDSVINVKVCRKRKLFCSCSCDGVIKIWDLHKTLLADVRLGENLTSCDFLNDNADLIIGWKHHLFMIRHKTLGLKFENDNVLDKWEIDSDIYEDPAVRHESLVKRKTSTEPITMKQYLVPYGFIACENMDDSKIMDVLLRQEEEIAESEDSDGTIRAMTETYWSPLSSVSSFRTIDSLCRIKSRALLSSRSADGQMLMMPDFGYSPGPSPSESIDSFLVNEDDQVFVGDLDDVIDPADQVCDVVVPMIKEEKIDLQKNLKTGVLVAKAYKNMTKGRKSSFGQIAEENENVSGGKGKKAKKLLKSGMNAALAVETMKSNHSKKLMSADKKAPSFRRIVKKTRRFSATNDRDLLVPSDVSVKFVDEKTLPNAQMSEELDDNIVEKLETMGLKVTPQAKPGTPVGRLQSTQSFTAPSQRKKMLSSGFSDKAGRRSSNRLKRKYSKSASGGNRNAVGKSGNGILTSSHIASKEKPQNQGTRSAETNRPSSNNTDDAIAVLSDVHLKQSKFVKLPKSDFVPEIGDKEEKLSEKPNMSLSSELSSQVGNSNEKHAIQMKQEKHKADDLSDKEKTDDLIEIEQLLMKCRGTPNGITDSDDEEDYVFPNLLGYDFHAIYKKDGLQFDENWQNRMLDRYMLMKLQKRQRQESAMSKRFFLEEEKRLRFISAQPDLAEKLEQTWYEDHDALTKYILNTALISGDSSSAPCDAAPSHSALPSRPVSSQSHMQKSVADGERNGKFRLSTRPKSSYQAYERDTKVNDPFSPRPASVRSSRMSQSKSVGNVSAERLLFERPRSSTSIPGKSRYILIRPEKDKKRANIVRNPTKLEEQLMLKRFPSQHSNVMKSLGRNTKPESPEVSDDEFQDISFHEIRASPVSPPITRKPHPICNTSSETVHRNISPTYPKLSENSMENSSAWKSPFCDAYINPMDIVKRKSSDIDKRTIEINLRSINA